MHSLAQPPSHRAKQTGYSSIRPTALVANENNERELNQHHKQRQEWTLIPQRELPDRAFWQIGSATITMTINATAFHSHQKYTTIYFAFYPEQFGSYLPVLQRHSDGTGRFSCCPLRDRKKFPTYSYHDRREYYWDQDLYHSPGSLS